MLKRMKKEDKYDSCVVCGAKTRFKKTTPLEMRSDYLPGAGQLCPRCAAQNIDEEKAAWRDLPMNFPFMKGMPEQAEYVRSCPSPALDTSRIPEIPNALLPTKGEVCCHA